MSRRRVTLADVAKIAGVSPTTASLVLSGRGRELRISQDVEQRVLKAAAESQYRPNIVSVGLRTGTTRTIGFISDTIATSRLAGDMIKGALEAARERGFMLFIGETEGDPELERLLLQAMHDRQVDGIILASMYTRTIKVPKGMAATPAVLLNALPKQPSPLPSVIPDEIEAGRIAARTLLDAGYREGIHLIGAGPARRNVPAGGSVAAVERLIGIREVLAEAGVKPASGHVCVDWQPEYGLAATRALLRNERPKALICFNDRIALGAYQALDDFGLKVPGDHPCRGRNDGSYDGAGRQEELGRASVDDRGRRHHGGAGTARVRAPHARRDLVRGPGPAISAQVALRPGASSGLTAASEEWRA